MCMWQSQAFGGALSLGGSVPAEYGTACAPPGRMEMPVVPAATAADAAPLSKLRRAIMWSSPIWRRLVAARGREYSPKAMPVYRLPGARSDPFELQTRRRCGAIAAADGAAEFGAARIHISFSGDEMGATIPIAAAAAQRATFMVNRTRRPRPHAPVDSCDRAL